MKEKRLEELRMASKSVRTVARGEMREGVKQELRKRNEGESSTVRTIPPHPFVSSGTADEGGEGVEGFL